MLIQATLNWHVSTQPLNPGANVFHYKSFLAVTDELHSFADAFVAQHFPAIQTITSAGGLFDTLVCLDLADPAGEYTHFFPTATHGDDGADFLPLWITASFEYRRLVRGQRSGRKGFGPIAESSNSGGQPDSGYEGTAATAATALGTPLRVGLIDTWFPVIGVRPATTGGAWSSHDISGVLFKGWGSQNTRKR